MHINMRNYEDMLNMFSNLTGVYIYIYIYIRFYIILSRGNISLANIVLKILVRSIKLVIINIKAIGA